MLQLARPSPLSRDHQVALLPMLYVIMLPECKGIRQQLRVNINSPLGERLDGHYECQGPCSTGNARPGSFFARPRMSLEISFAPRNRRKAGPCWAVDEKIGTVFAFLQNRDSRKRKDAIRAARQSTMDLTGLTKIPSSTP